MSLDKLWDHRAIIYRPEETRDELQDTILLYLPLEGQTGMNSRPNQDWSGSQTDHGPGEQQAALRQWFLDKRMPVAERDVLKIVAGPEAPLQVRVESVTRPTNGVGVVNHLEVIVAVSYEDLGEEAVVES